MQTMLMMHRLACNDVEDAGVRTAEGLGEVELEMIRWTCVDATVQVRYSPASAAASDEMARAM